MKVRSKIHSTTYLSPIISKMA